MTSLTAYLVLVALVAGERGVELLLARRNGERAIARGGIETGQRHYRVMVLFHVAFLAACVVEAVGLHRTFPPFVGWLSLTGVLIAQILRYSAVIALGDRWNSRIIVTPGLPPIARGPYRFVRHPNYVAVAIELVALPMVYGCWLTALFFSLGNIILMATRIPAEEAALGPEYRRAFARLPRFLPKIRRFRSSGGT